MAVIGDATAQSTTGVRPVRIRSFVRLKLRIIRNSLRGKTVRIVLFVVGTLIGLWFAYSGFFLFALPNLAVARAEHGASADQLDLAVVVPAFAGAALVLGWLLLPLVFFGVDETLDPARFALLPLPRRTLVAGLLTAALIGIPALSVLLATSGLAFGVAVRGGWVAAVAQGLGVVAGLLLCVAASRAVTSAFATMLRSRRVRDLAAIMLAALAALIGPLQLAGIAAAEQADYHRLVGPARVLGWTPLAAPYTLGTDVVEGHGWAVPVKLAITALAIAALLWWWSASLESAMVGAEASGSTRAVPQGRGGPVAQLFPRALPWLPRSRYGALVAREARYWWRDARRRANLISLMVIGVFIPVISNLNRAGLFGSGDRRPSVTSLTISMIFIAVLGAAGLANQFGFDGSAYATHLIAGVPGRVELRARVVAFAVYLVPLLTVISALVALLLGEPGWLPAVLGTVYAAYGVGLAANLLMSIFAAYALPQTANPFAISTGAGTAKSLLSFIAMLAAMAATAPYAVAAVLLHDTTLWTWLAAPTGLGYGLGAVALGTYIAGDALDRRGPELLVAVS